MKKLIVGLFALALIASPAFAGGECCDKAKKDGKTCEKCTKKDCDKKDDKKEEKK